MKNLLPNLMFYSSIVCIVVHLVATLKCRDYWTFAKAGIAREFQRKIRLY